MIEPTVLRTLTLREPSRPGRPAHVSAASGLVRVGDRLYVAVDDENHLAVFDAEGAEPGSLKRVFAGVLPNAPDARKRNKADVESIVRLPPFERFAHGAMLLLGSCSKRHRCHSVLLGLDAQGELDATRLDLDLAPLHDAFGPRFGRLNIEGAVVLGDELVLLQRGNKGDRRNARIRMRLDAVLESFVRSQRLGTEPIVAIDVVELGGIGDVPLCFTDGDALADGRMVFTAIAENTDNSYDDGPCCGAAVGIIDPAGRVGRIEALDPRYKVEGIDAAIEGDAIRALLVTDADDASVAATLLACEIRA